MQAEVRSVLVVVAHEAFESGPPPPDPALPPPDQCLGASDIKTLGRIGDGPGHRAHGDRSTRHRGVGREYLYIAVDDASRLVYCEPLEDEAGLTATGFPLRTLRWFKSQGVAVYRVLTDNGSPFLSRRWRRTRGLQPDHGTSRRC